MSESISETIDEWREAAMDVLGRPLGIGHGTTSGPTSDEVELFVTPEGKTSLHKVSLYLRATEDDEGNPAIEAEVVDRR